MNSVSPLECDINENLFIEASAGTGKTYTIEHLVIRRIITPLTNGNWVSMRNIAITTFTRACSIELSTRIYDTLRNTISLLDKRCYEKLPVYLSNLQEEALYEAKKRLKIALFEFEESIISTIHGFSKRVLADYFQTDMAFQQPSWLDKNTLTLLIRNFFDLKIFENYFYPQELKIILKGNSLDYELVIEKIVSSIFKKNTSNFILETTKVFSNIREEVTVLKREHKLDKDIVFETLLNESSNFNGLKSKNGELKESVLNSFTAFSKLFSDEWGIDEENDLIENGSFSKLFQNEKKRGKKEEKSVISVFAEKLFPLLEQVQEYDIIFKRLLIAAYEFLKNEMRKWGYLVPDDLLLQMQESLADQGFCNYMRNRFLTVFIDEFQDTDPIQWDIISKLFAKNQDSLLYLVGDPKQAIYAFRNADVYSYMSAREEKIFNHLTLTTNYRSSDSLVSALNLLFSSIHSSYSFFLPKLSLNYQATGIISANRSEELKSQDRAPITFFSVKGKLGRKRNWPHEEAEILLFNFIYKEILLLSSQGIKLQDCAILVKDRFQAERLEDFLEKRKMNHQSLRKESIGNTSAHALLKRLFSAIYHPRDLSHLMHLLLLEPFSIKEEELKQLTNGNEESLKQRAHYVENLVSIRSAFEKSGISCLAEKFFSTLWQNESTLEKICKSNKDLYIDLEHLFDLLIQEEQKRPLTLDSVIDHLKTLEAESQFDNGLSVKRAKKDNSVPILTMHRSKGLEFEVVFALGVSSRTPLIDDINHSEIDAEKIRLFYVAATRAKRRLYIPLPFEEEDKKIKMGSCSPLELFLTYLSLSIEGKATNSLIKQREKIYEEINQNALLTSVSFLEKESGLITQVEVPYSIEPVSESVQVEDVSQLEPIKSLNPIPPILLSSFSKRKQPKEKLAIILEENKTLPHGKEEGLIIHELIHELLTYPDTLSPYSREHFSKLIKPHLKTTILSEYEEELGKILSNVFNCQFSLDKLSFSLKEIDLQNCFCEKEFIYREKENSYVQGIFDLAFVYRDSYFLIDWKTNYLGDSESAYSIDALHECIKREQYDLQASIYTTSFDRYLHNYNKKCAGLFFVFLRGLKPESSDGIVFLKTN